MRGKTFQTKTRPQVSYIEKAE